MIEIDGQSFTVPAELIAEGLKLPPETVQPGLASRAISSWAETGVGEDFGTFRLTFATDRRRLRLVVDALGTVLSRSAVDFGTQPLPPAARRPGTP